MDACFDLEDLHGLTMDAVGFYTGVAVTRVKGLEPTLRYSDLDR